MRILIILLLTPLSIHAIAQTSGVIATISQSQTTPVPPEPPDPTPETGIHVAKTGSDGAACDFDHPCLTITKGESVAVTGDTVWIHAGTFRETVTVTKNGVVFVNYPGDEVFVSGVEDVGNSGWTLHAGNIWKKIITPPLATDYATSTSTNTGLLANQVFQNGYMMIQARSNNLPGTTADVEALMSMSSFNSTTNATVNTGSQLTDPQNPPVNVSNSQILFFGWFIANSGLVTGSSGNSVFYNSVNGDIKFRERCYITGDLDLLDSQNEYHWEGGTLYAYVIGGGSPTNLTYKVRRWGFLLNNRSNIVIKGINFFACEPVWGNTSTTNCTLDGLDMSGNYGSTIFYASHAYFIPNEDYNYGMSQFTGIQMLGSGNVVKNCDFKYTSGTSIWAGQGMVIDNNRFQYIGYQGDYSAPVRFSGNVSSVQITRNLMYYINRAGINFNRGGSESHNNLDIGFNDIEYFSQLSNDVGAVYGSQRVRIDGTRIHHNWFGFNVQPNHEGFGAQIAGVYQDQLSGYCTIDHNVAWGGSVGDMFHERSPNTPSPDHVPPTNYYNNTLGVTGYGAYISHVPLGPPYDVIRNQYSAVSDIFCSGGCGNNKAYSVTGGSLSTYFVGGDLNTLKGLYFQLKPGSPLIDAGVSIPGITSSVTGTAPDIGAMEFGVSPFIPGPTWD